MTYLENLNSAPMANILIQSIQNEDKVKLESVLRHGSQRFIEETISKLPIELYVPFLNLVIICIINVAHRYIKRISKERFRDNQMDLLHFDYQSLIHCISNFDL
ncbi:hypothetical protein HZS_4338 [Henneguya salminicola]|nr:hypothetical protein HZS_4338 [Henneguya salminicola]